MRATSLVPAIGQKKATHDVGVRESSKPNRSIPGSRRRWTLGGPSASAIAWGFNSMSTIVKQRLKSIRARSLFFGADGLPSCNGLSVPTRRGFAAFILTGGATLGDRIGWGKRVFRRVSPFPGRVGRLRAGAEPPAALIGGKERVQGFGAAILVPKLAGVVSHGYPGRKSSAGRAVGEIWAAGARTRGDIRAGMVRAAVITVGRMAVDFMGVNLPTVLAGSVWTGAIHSETTRSPQRRDWEL